MNPDRPGPKIDTSIRAYVEAQRDWVIDTLSRLIAYPSTSGNEREVMAFIETLVKDLRGELWRLPVPDSVKADPDFSPSKAEQPYAVRPNLVNFRRGRGQGRSLILCSHADVVPADWPEAFTARLEGDVLYGRGACDDKGPMVASLLALRTLDHLGIELAGDLETQFVVEEETGGNGALALILGGRRADGVIVLEASDLDICPAGRGALWFRVDVEGRSTHMAYIREGVNAAKEAIKVIQALESYERRLIEDSRGNPLFARFEQPVMVNIGTLHSGEWPATVPPQATIEGGVGFLPNRNLDIVRREVEAAILDEAGEWVRDHHQTSFTRLHNEAYQLDANHPLVTALQRACDRAGLAPDVCGLIASCDARLYYHRGGMPPLVFGPGSIRHAHSREEHISITDILRAAESLVYLACEWCGEGQKALEA
jgi:acetylornithine deacetylase